LTAGRTNLGDDGVRAFGRSPDGDGGDATATAAGVGAPALVGGASMHRRRPPVRACEPVLIQRWRLEAARQDATGRPRTVQFTNS